MVERKLYKTKLCVLYQKGYCPRQSCSFAHGDAELRGSISGRRYHRGGDLRDKIERKRSPERRYSPLRDANGRRSQLDYSPSRSFERKSNRKRRKKQLLDSQSDFSGSQKISDGTEDRAKEGKIPSTDSRNVLEEQLKQVESDIKMMDEHKCQLELCLEEKAQEVDSLASRIKELEAQLNKEKEESKRLTSKIKKFLKAHNRHTQIQDELRRSQSQLHKLGDQLGSDFTKLGAHEEDSNIDIVSAEENTGNHLMTPGDMMENTAARSKKRSRINLNATEELPPGDLTNGEGYLAKAISSKKPSRWNLVDHSQLNNDKLAVDSGNDGRRPMAGEAKRKGGKIVSTSSRSSDKFKVSDSAVVLPSTSMAAHAVDEVVEAIDEEKIEVVETASERINRGAVHHITGLPLPLPPPPPIRQKAYSQYKGDDENVDVDGLEEAVDVDII